MNETNNSIYGDALPRLNDIMMYLVNEIEAVRQEEKERLGFDPVEHCLYRIKSEESMREKCRRKGLPETPESALQVIHDAIGIRVVCSFVNDVYKIKDRLIALPECEIVSEKDYIRHAKINGYRSYHLILRVRGNTHAEIQLRTISMDTWAALEHHMTYKKTNSGADELIYAELKRCADELASTDITMQTIKDMIYENTHS